MFSLMLILVGRVCAMFSLLLVILISSVHLKGFPIRSLRLASKQCLAV